MLAVEMLSEPVHVPDTPVAGLSHVEDLGDGMYRLTFYAVRQSLYGGTDYTVEVKLIATLPAILDGVKTALIGVGHRCCGALKDRLTCH